MVNHGYDNYCHISSDVSQNIFILYGLKKKSQTGQFHFLCNLTNMFFSLHILIPIFLCNLTNMFFAFYIFRYPKLPSFLLRI